MNMDFSGRADLVLALVDEQGGGAAQVVDLKTRGCLAAFNEDEPTRGHPSSRCRPAKSAPCPKAMMKPTSSTNTAFS